MPINFHKFVVEKKGIFSISDFIISDEDGNKIFEAEKSLWSLKSKTKILSTNGKDVFELIAPHAFSGDFNLYHNGELIAYIDRKSAFTSGLIIKAKGISPFEVKSNMWGSEFKFVRGKEEIAIVSHKSWPKSKFGVAIKEGEKSAVILAVIIVLSIIKSRKNG